MNPPVAVCLLSGGLDSTTLVYAMMDMGYTPVALSVMYGQRHSVELEYAKRTTEKLKIRHEFVDLQSAKALLSGSSLTSDAPVPEGHYEAANMASTVVPNRNAILLALAYGFAVTVHANKVCTAVHAGDHAIYPDCRPEFIRAFELMEKASITREIYGMGAPSLYAPFLHLAKQDIAKLSEQYGVPPEDTWSCYKGGDAHCGRCGTCVERIEAFLKAGVPDPTVYVDYEYAVMLLADRGA